MAAQERLITVYKIKWVYHKIDSSLSCIFFIMFTAQFYKIKFAKWLFHNFLLNSLTLAHFVYSSALLCNSALHIDISLRFAFHTKEVYVLKVRSIQVNKAYFTWWSTLFVLMSDIIESFYQAYIIYYLLCLKYL